MILAIVIYMNNLAGNNTLFEVKVQSDLAIEYCNISVMEKMHLSKTM